MALQKDIDYNGVTVIGAYGRIEEQLERKQSDGNYTVIVRFKWRASVDNAPLHYQPHTYVIEDVASPSLTDSYEHLKTLDKFSGATDV